MKSYIVTDNGYTIPYAFSGDTSVKTAAEVVNNTYNINVDVAAAAWNLWTVKIKGRL